MPGTTVVGIWLQKMFQKMGGFKCHSHGFMFLCEVCGLFFFLLRHLISSKLTSWMDEIAVFLFCFSFYNHSFQTTPKKGAFSLR